MISSKDLIKQFEHHYNISKQGLKGQYRHIQECQAFYSGDYMAYKDAYAFGRGSSRRLKEVQFNRVKPYVNSIVGFMAQQRRKPNYEARMKDKQEQLAYSDYLNGLSDYIRENAHADQIETKQDLDFIIGGVGVTDTMATIKSEVASREPNGEVLIERVDPLHAGWDPNSVETNLLDSKWVYRAKDYDVEEAEELFNAEEEDFEFVDNVDDIENYRFNPFGGIQDKIGYEWSDPERRMVRVYFYQWFEVETYYRIENPIMQAPELQGELISAFSVIEPEEGDEAFSTNLNGEIVTITKAKRKQVKEIYEFYGLEFNPMDEKRKVYYTAILSGNRVFSKFKSPTQQGFTMKFKTGDRDEVNKIWTGIVASMRDPQRYYNKSLTELMLIIASNSRGGVMYEEDAVDNVQEFEAQWAMNNAAVRVNSGALSGGKIQPKATAAMPSGYENILQISGDSLSAVTGIDESFFGAISGGNETAMLQRQRIKQATVSLALYFDAASLYATEQARMMLSYIRILAEANSGRLFRVYDDDGQPLFEEMRSDFLVDEYDITIGEAPETPIQQEYYTQTLMGMAQSMQAIGS